MSSVKSRNSFQNFFYIPFFADMIGKNALLAELVGTIRRGVGVASGG